MLGDGTKEGTMESSERTTVDRYIASQPAAMRDALDRVRSAMRKALPGAEERISYNMPSYKLRGAAPFVSLHGNGTIHYTSQARASSRRSKTSSHRMK